GGLIKGLMFTAVPAAYIGHVPTEFVRSPSLSSAAILVAVSIAYSVGACFLFRQGLQRYSSGSRFTLHG
ncbi:MAG TPA: hypothetical protein VKP30_21970, partial [Polyangiaceae bacterium]|nr:hypothetical protein [Polyangiaceae bacterium]